MAISDSFDVLCFDLYLINIFVKSMKVERCTDIMFKLTLYCLSDTVIDLNGLLQKNPNRGVLRI